jgi:hypothetical protein
MWPHGARHGESTESHLPCKTTYALTEENSFWSKRIGIGYLAEV